MTSMQRRTVLGAAMPLATAFALGSSARPATAATMVLRFERLTHRMIAAAT